MYDASHGAVKVFQRLVFSKLKPAANRMLAKGKGENRLRRSEVSSLNAAAMTELGNTLQRLVSPNDPVRPIHDVVEMECCFQHITSKCRAPKKGP